MEEEPRPNATIRMEKKLPKRGRRMRSEAHTPRNNALWRCDSTACDAWQDAKNSTLKNQKLLWLIMFNILCGSVPCVRIDANEWCRWSDAAKKSWQKFRMHTSTPPTNNDRKSVCQICTTAMLGATPEKRTKNKMKRIAASELAPTHHFTFNCVSTVDSRLSPVESFSHSPVARTKTRVWQSYSCTVHTFAACTLHTPSNIENGITCQMEHLREKWLVDVRSENVVDDDDEDDNTTASHSLWGEHWLEYLGVCRACRISVKINGPIKKVNKLFVQNGILTTHTNSHRSRNCGIPRQSTHCALHIRVIVWVWVVQTLMAFTTHRHIAQYMQCTPYCCCCRPTLSDI